MQVPLQIEHTLRIMRIPVHSNDRVAATILYSLCMLVIRLQRSHPHSSPSLE